MKNLVSFLLIVFLFTSFSNAQQGLYEPLDLSKVKMEFDDFGKMWTFDDIPLDKWENQYGI